jgi:hypothetical protein
MINGRALLGITLSARGDGAHPRGARAFEQSGGRFIQRAIPSSGEMVPVISFGARPADDAAVKAILKTVSANLA